MEQRTIDLLNGLQFDESLEPLYDPMRSSLVWMDEGTFLAIGGKDREFLLDVIVSRSLFYHGLLDYFETCGHKDWYGLSELNEYKNKWDIFKATVPSWPGFRRLNLTEKNKQCLQKGLADPNPFD